MPIFFNHLKPGGCLAAILTLALAPAIPAAGVPLTSVAESDSASSVHRDTIRFFRSQAPASFLGYTLVHPVQTARGISRNVTCEVRLTHDTLGSAITCWSQVDTFVSGSEGRDAAMRDAVEWLEYPEVGFAGKVVGKVMRPVMGKAVAGAAGGKNQTPAPRRPSPPNDSKGASSLQLSHWEIAGELDFHGIRRPLRFQASVVSQGQAVLIQGGFALSLTDHKVARPVLLFKPTEDTVRIDMHLVMQ
jgi:YceI-like domain